MTMEYIDVKLSKPMVRRKPWDDRRGGGGESLVWSW